MSSISARNGSAQLLRFSRRNTVKSIGASNNSLLRKRKQTLARRASTKKMRDENDEPLKLLTPEILCKLQIERKLRAENMRKIKKSAAKITKEKLVNGEIVIDDNEENEYENEEEREYDEIIFNGLDHTLNDGNQLPIRYGKVTKDLLQKPLVELDPYINVKQETFIIISKRLTSYYIQRFSSNKALFLFSPFNWLRRALLWLITWQFFDWFMIVTILVNCIFMAIPMNQSDQIDYVFVSIYTLESIIKICAKGFIIDNFSYLRDPWNWLDFIVLLLSYVTILVSALSVNNSINISAIRALRVLRALKTINIITGLKTIVNAIFKSLKNFLEVIILMAFILVIFSLYTLEVYKGAMSKKCVLQYNPNSSIEYKDWIKNENNWLFDDNLGEYVMCTNTSSFNYGRICDDGYVCLIGIGQNPNSGLTAFDNFGLSMMINFQLFNLDHFEDIYNKVIDSMGFWNVIFFVPVVFIGSYYLINLVLAVVVLAYENEAIKAKKKLEAPPPKKNAIIYDLVTLKKKIAEKAKEIEDKKRKRLERGMGGKSMNQTIDRERTIDNQITNDGTSNEITSGYSYVNEAKDNQINSVVPISLNQEMGKFNKSVQEGINTAHFIGRELVSGDENFVFCLKLGKNYKKWTNFQKKIHSVVFSLYFEIFITFCIVLNTIIMAIQYDGQPSTIDDLQNYANIVISSIFILESLLKVIALGRLFFFDASNWFDVAIIVLSIIDFAVPQVQGLSVFRTFRLMRIFKLAKTWKTMRKILSIVLDTVSALGYLSIILLLIVYIFSIIGGDLLKDAYTQYYSDELPRSNFNDILHSFLAIFRILCGEYTQPMIECWVAAGPVCSAVFYPTILFGNFIILNLYLALLLNAFDADSFQKEEKSDDGEFGRQWKNILKKTVNGLKVIQKIVNKKTVTPSELEHKNNVTGNGHVVTDEEKEEASKQKTKPNNNNNNELKVEPCFPTFVYKRIFFKLNRESNFYKNWRKFRLILLRIIENKLFEGFIILSILASSITLAFDDVYLKNNSYEDVVLKNIDYTFLAIFFLEMVLKLFAYGFKKYFTDQWCLLDFSIVVVNFLDLYFSLNGMANVGFLKVLRSLRAFRPLRTISRLEGMKIVVYALANSIPAIFNVFVVCLLFWLIFSIMGVTLFKGKFYKCVDSNSGLVLSDVSNKTDCLRRNNSMWYNSKTNFDNVPNGYLALFQIATFEGWQEIIQDGVDSTDIDIQPSREANMWAYIYFVAFIIFGAFFTLNLFIGVIIDNFNILKKQYEGSVVDVFLSPSQLAYFQTMKKIINAKPQKAIKRPENKVQSIIFDIVLNTKFEISISFLILINAALLTIEYYGQPAYYDDILSIINTTFVSIYGLEAIFKLIGTRLHYFRSAWNVFDLIVTIFCFVNIPLEYLNINYFIRPSLLRLLRIFNTTRVLRTFKPIKGIRKLLSALVVSIPGLFNISALLFLIMYMYAIIGMNFFMNVKLNNALTETVNFQTFGKSFTLLFRLSTAGGWNDILNSLMLTANDPGSNCDDKYDLQSLASTVNPKTANGCGNVGLAIAFMVSYVFIMRLIMMNMFIAVIFDNYNETHKQEEIGITLDDCELFYKTWEKYDPQATQFIKLDKLSDLVAELEPPLGISKPNEMAVVSFDLPIIKGDMIHCLDVLHGLIKYALDNIEDNSHFHEIQKVIDKNFITHFPLRVHHVPVTTTIQRKKMDIAARTLQREWRKFKLHKTLRQHIIHRKSTEVQNQPS